MKDSNYLPSNGYRLPILRVLNELGGSAPANKVIEKVYDIVKGNLTYNDVNEINSGEVAWRNRLRWCKLSMVNDGDLVKMPKGSGGIWSLSQQGKKNLKRYITI